MVIDDDESIRFVLNHLFSKNGFKVATLAKADAAFNVIDVFKPDVILLDIKLDQLDGRDISIELKANEETKNIKIVLFSGFVLDEAECIDYGADDFICP